MVGFFSCQFEWRDCCLNTIPNAATAINKVIDPAIAGTGFRSLFVLLKDVRRIISGQ
jgi:hypothetical protein